jgi:hypothetical protein
MAVLPFPVLGSWPPEVTEPGLEADVAVTDADEA